jgi:hypothetical protein
MSRHYYLQVLHLRMQGEPGKPLDRMRKEEQENGIVRKQRLNGGTEDH